LTGAELLLLLVTLQRIGELALARHNTRKLMARGAVEVASEHYPWIVALHTAWLSSLWLLGHDQPVDAVGLALYVALQGLRCWVLWTLGSRWTTRIIVLPGEPLVAAGPYRLMSHPNYAVVVGEIAVLPWTLGLRWLAVVFTLLNAALLLVRLRAENRALAALPRAQMRDSR
jgi:methyltransferase